MFDLFFSPIFLQVGAITIILLLFTYAAFKYLTYTTPNPDAKIKLSDKDPNHKLKGFKRQDLSIHELRNYDGKHKETNFVIFVAVNGYIFDVTVDRNLYGPGGHYFALAGRDASRALSKFTISCDSLPTEVDLMPDLTPSEVAQLNEWYNQFSERYQCVGRLIRSNQERYVYDHSDEEILGDSDEIFDNEIQRYCGIQTDARTVPPITNNNPFAHLNGEEESTVATDQFDCSSDQYNKPLLNELNCENKYSKKTPTSVSKTKVPDLTENESSDSSLWSINILNADKNPTELEFTKKTRSSSSRSTHNGDDLIKQ